MADTFLSFIEARRARISKQIQRLERALMDLDNSVKLYKLSQAATGSSPQSTLDLDGDSESIPISRASTTEGGPSKISLGIALEVGGQTIKERVRQLLVAYPEGKTSDEILAALRSNGMPNLVRSSLSPQLSRLKQANVLDRQHGRWLLVRQKTGVESGSQPPSDSDQSA